MKLWQKSSSVFSEKIDRFTVGKDRELDVELAPFDVLGSLAHTRMLASVNLLTDEELEHIQNGLKTIYSTIEQGDFMIEDGVEDVHSQVELILTRTLGDVGKKIHSGRSRNDQVLVDLKLFFLAEIEKTTELIVSLFAMLQQRSEAHQADLMPGYTHTQIAMPSSFGLWFGAFAEALIDDLRLMLAVWEVVGQNPLGSAAGYGSSFPLDREMTTALLGFPEPAYNVVYAQLGRGKTEQMIGFALASLGATLNKMATDAVLFSSQNFGFFTLPEELTTGSSIMPHKKNPDVFELLRAKTAMLQALPSQISHITTNLISGYHRDLQLVKEIILPAFTSTQDCLDICIFAIEKIKVHAEVIDDPLYTYLFTVEEVNKLVLEGVPFRDAYVAVGDKVRSGAYKPDTQISHTHLGSIGNLANDEIRLKMEKVRAKFGFSEVRKAWKKLLR